ncbi:hypothetical protein F0U61_10605 [Archangium violaceum]|uniref:hypothetical protein n=1 Tax=Archangium violaceum TaxID=83451 RepID=UPI002B304FBE|nr:hypothetical protein F0U61_10605 [Archangium violaceum]
MISACSCSGGGGGGKDGGGGGGGSSDATHFFLPTKTGDNTAAPSLAVDGAGGVHTVYPTYAGGGAYYAYCANGCQRASDISVVRFETEGTVANVALTLNAQGKPRVLMSAYAKVYYASCDSNCTDQSGWKVTPIIEHSGKKEVTGPAFALDPQGRPRFLLHTHITYAGIGQGEPRTEYVTCDTNCHDPSAWKAYPIAEQIWHRTRLRFNAEGQPRLGTIVRLPDASVGFRDYGTYVECHGDCTQDDAWEGVALVEAYADENEAVTLKPSISLDLTSSGAPRLLVLAAGAGSKKQLLYMSCDQQCKTGDQNWTRQLVSENAEITDGVDLALDAQGHPRAVYSLDYNIMLASCDAANCAAADAKWTPQVVEAANNMKADEIFLYENCTVGTWFLHTPSLVLTREGGARIGYQSRDVSGGWIKKDPNGPDCVAGTDMTWSRLAVIKP